MSEDKVYSHNEEDWVEDFCTALDYAKQDCLYDHDRPTVYVGNKVPITNKYLSSDSGSLIVDNLKEWAIEEVGHHAERYLDDLSRDKIDELSGVIGDWLDKSAGKPNFYSVDGVEEYKD